MKQLSKEGKERFTLEQLKTLPEDTRETLVRKNYILIKKFQALDANYRKVMPMYTQNKKKIAERDATIAALRAECAALKKARPAVEEDDRQDDQQDDNALPSLFGRPRASSHGPPGSFDNDPAAALSFSSDPGPDAASDESSLDAPPQPSARRERAEVPPSEATTVGSDPVEPELPPLPRAVPEENVVIKDESSSDGPIFVTERSVRKRKATDDADGRPTPKRAVKQEDSDDSDPPRVRAVPEQDSLDLDEVGPRLNTPRKLKLWADNPTTAPGTARRILQGDVARAGQLRTPVANTARPPIESSVLTPVDANIRARKPQTVAGKSNKLSLASRIGVLAEDGGNLYQRAVRRKTGTHLQETPEGGDRLSRLLNSPGRAEQPTILRSAPPPRRREDAFELPPRRELPFDRTGRLRAGELTPSRTAKTTDRGVTAPLTSAVAKARTDTTDPPRQNRKDQQQPAPHGKLRQKDVSELRPEDFKINPRTNDGADFAYGEVVRGRAERACLDGCTDMSCCGPTFRALAMVEMRKRTPADDARLFEEYLGDGVSRVHGLSRQEKDELWLEAKTWQLAKTQGKHRHRHGRRASPPGFWETGFPTSQEVAAEKEEAARREKAVVRERHREAMRTGGRWLFRDE